MCRDQASTSAAPACVAPMREADLIDAIAEGRDHAPLSTSPDMALPRQPPAQQPAPAQQSAPVQRPASLQPSAQGDAQKPKVELHMSTAVRATPNRLALPKDTAQSPAL